MKNIIKFSKIFFLLVMALTLCTCKKNKFLDVNNNPNYPATVSVNLALASSEANIGFMVGNTLAIYGGLWSQYWTQDPTYGSQYGAFDDYINAPSDNDNVWQALYTTATTLNYIIANADSTQKNYAAIAYFLKAYDFQLLTDGWDAVPCTKALQGANGNFNPTFDAGPIVYDSVILWINEGMKLVQTGTSSPPEDLIYPTQPMTQWQKFANTLMLRVLLRESAVVDVHAQMTALATSAASTGGFLSTPADDAQLVYKAQTYQQSPLYATQYFLNYRNIIGSATVINYLLSVNDPRLQDFYQGRALDGTYAGELQGDWKALAFQSDQVFSAPSSLILGPTAPTKFLTASESNFLQAEAMARGLMTGNAATAYYAGINASWSEWPNATSQIGTLATYEAQPLVNFSNASGLQGQVNLIITQKWLAMCGNQTFEAWTEWRRTGYPKTPGGGQDIFIHSLSSSIPNETPNWPLRLVYPDAELLENGNFPKSGEVLINVPVWWGVANP